MDQALIAVAQPDRLRRQPGGTQTQKKHQRKHHGKHDRAQLEPAEKPGIAKPPDHGNINDADQRFGDKGERGRQGNAPDIAMTDGKRVAGKGHARNYSLRKIAGIAGTWASGINSNELTLR